MRARKVSHRSRRRCTTGKRRYRDREEAKTMLGVFREGSTREKVQVRVYKCPFCKGWHLTSQEQRA